MNGRPPYVETEAEERIRFQTELEFVQLLANATYLNYLAQYKIFDDPDFIAYIDYLQYWRKPEYAKFISYPHCLYFLERIKDEKFREECKKVQYRDFVHNQQNNCYTFYRQNREKEAQEKSEVKKDPQPDVEQTK
ncbi:mediator of RNA polymerase II transcription subunit 31 [Acrasis kona]|uniref:Mediator of RNA polymerase II transcription subunit 31 n=1 Tax=Acrasis kona TaxID=1008807 RepID=A0AAW2YZX0_9EUKA